MDGDADVCLATPDDLDDLLRFNHGEKDVPHWSDAVWPGYLVVAPEPPRKQLWQLRNAAGELRGWLAASQVAETAELEYLLVAATARGHGYGQRLLCAWLKFAAQQGTREALLEVRPSNLAALALYRRAGFREMGRRRQYYRAPTEDAVMMRRTLPISEPC